jgi:hypothetical protein
VIPSREVTGLLIFSSPVLLAALDLLLYEVGGNEATISKLMLDTYQKHPSFGWVAVELTMMLFAHLFWPTHQPARGWREWTAFAIIAVEYGFLAWNLWSELHIGKRMMAFVPWTSPPVWVAVAGSIGLGLGHWLCPQHLVK